MAERTGIVAVGGSAGGIEALVALVAGLPSTVPAPILVTVHVGERARSRLPEILSRAGVLPASHARPGETLRPGHVYVAPPDRHLLVGAGGVARLSHGPRVNRHRPAVDVMFTSAARWAGPGTVAVVLSGMLDDGAVGAALVARAGGRVVVQEPTEAIFDSMPRSALAAVPAAQVAATEQLGKAVCELLGDGRADAVDVPEHRSGWVRSTMSMADSDDPGFLGLDEARLTRLSCPECGGGLAELDISDIRYYRCHVGHQYSPQVLETAQREAAEAKLWSAVAALEEHAALARHLANHGGMGSEEELHRAADRSAATSKSLQSRLRRPEGEEAS